MPSKKAARLAREAKKLERQEAKSARLCERVANQNTVRMGGVGLQGRAVRTGADPGSIYHMKMEWTEEHADRDGDWSWGPRDWGDEAWAATIFPKLEQWQRLFWHEVEAFTTGSGHRMNHLMPTDRICPESQDRLNELNHLADDIYRFRLGSRRRLWGFRIVNEFQMLWYDPEHNIYPTDPD